MKWTHVFLVVMAATSADARNRDSFLCREIGNKWVWFEDHVSIYVKYGVVGPDGRRYEVGTGPSVSGSPWGRRVVKSGRSEILAIGIGAIHIRKDDDGSDFVVCASGLGLKAIPIFPTIQF